MAITMTPKQAAALGLNSSSAPKKRRKQASRAKLNSNRKLTMCAICGSKISPSSPDQPSHGWAKNMTGWAQGSAIGALAPYCHDCFMDWMREWREGIPQI